MIELKPEEKQMLRGYHKVKEYVAHLVDEDIKAYIVNIIKPRLNIPLNVQLGVTFTEDDVTVTNLKTEDGEDSGGQE